MKCQQLLAELSCCTLHQLIVSPEMDDKSIFQFFITMLEDIFPILYGITYFLSGLFFLFGYILYFAGLDEREGKQFISRSLITLALLIIFFNPMSTNVYQYLNISPLDKIDLSTSSKFQEIQLFMIIIIWMINLFLFLAAFASLIAFLVFLVAYINTPSQKNRNLLFKAFLGILLIIYPLSWQFPSFPRFKIN